MYTEGANFPTTGVVKYTHRPRESKMYTEGANFPRKVEVE